MIDITFTENEIDNLIDFLQSEFPRVISREFTFGNMDYYRNMFDIYEKLCGAMHDFLRTEAADV